MNSFKIESIYHDYLEHEQLENRKKYKKYQKWFSASSAGYCYRRQLHKLKDDIQHPIKPTIMRKVRMGTVVHDDLEKAMIYWTKNNNYSDISILTEHRIELPDLNVVGHLDLCVIIEEDIVKCTVYDYKTANSYKWKVNFGRDAYGMNETFYYMQLATYGMGMAKELDIFSNEITLKLVWYNKDTSVMREQLIPNTWFDEALEYWTLLNEIAEEVNNEPTSLHPGDVGVPFKDWECGYCPYQGTVCPGKSKLGG